MEYLDFELPLKELEDQLEKCNEIHNESKVDVKDTYKNLKAKIEQTKKDIYSNLTPWQRVQLSRHPSRPYTLDYINALTDGNFLELHGDRNISDDKAMIGGLGKINNQSFMFIGQQKGNNIKTRQYAKRQTTWSRGRMQDWNKEYSNNFSQLSKKVLKVIS